MTNQEAILDAIKRANKLGAEGIQVVGYTEPNVPTQDNRFILAVRYPRPQSAAKVM